MFKTGSVIVPNLICPHLLAFISYLFYPDSPKKISDLLENKKSIVEEENSEFFVSM